MNPVILIIIILLIIILPIIFLYKLYKKAENYIEKTFFIVLVIVYLVPVIIYYLDKFNVPTIFEMTENINPQNWLNFVSNYITSIISTIIGGIITMFITMSEIQRNNEDTEKEKKKI